MRMYVCRIITVILILMVLPRRVRRLLGRRRTYPSEQLIVRI